LLAAVVVLAATALVGLGLLGQRTTQAARARTAADAAALAGTLDGEAGARRLAAANGGTVVAFHVLGDDVVVTVVVGAARATARATLSFDG
jgi:hypothetical protein